MREEIYFFIALHCVPFNMLQTSGIITEIIKHRLHNIRVSPTYEHNCKCCIHCEDNMIDSGIATEMPEILI